MTVKELIIELQKVDENLTIVVEKAWYQGYLYPKRVRKTTIESSLGPTECIMLETSNL